MAQFTIKWPNGAEATYEGDVSFADFRELLDGEPPRIANESATAVPPPRERMQAAHPTAKDPENGPEPPRVDFAYLDARLQEVGARTDVERLTVLAHVAVEAGASGLDIDTAESWYRELALRMPGVWRSTFANAQARGYLRREGRGLWRPTSAGENFARRGERRPSPARRVRRTRQGAAAS